MTSSFPLAATLSVFGFATTFAAVSLLKRVAFKFGLVSKPGGRRNHAELTPLLGGFAVYPAFATVLLVFLLLVGLGTISVPEPSTAKMVSLFAAHHVPSRPRRAGRQKKNGLAQEARGHNFSEPVSW